jgi:hypothetical protein
MTNINITKIFELSLQQLLGEETLDKSGKKGTNEKRGEGRSCDVA